jgi:hypothetical protein
MDNLEKAYYDAKFENAFLRSRDQTPTVGIGRTSGNLSQIAKRRFGVMVWLCPEHPDESQNGI